MGARKFYPQPTLMVEVAIVEVMNPLSQRLEGGRVVTGASRNSVGELEPSQRIAQGFRTRCSFSVDGSSASRECVDEKADDCRDGRCEDGCHGLRP